jgi:hypothetical protein
MRRILAITLLIAFGSPLVVPLLASTTNSQSNLPACCRRNGAHHCTGLMSSAASGPALNAPPCPVYPSPSMPLRLIAAALAAPPALSIEPLRSFTPLAPGGSLALFSIPSSNQKRGPPAPLT